jgi:hypothetical protein
VRGNECWKVSVGHGLLIVFIYWGNVCKAPVSVWRRMLEGECRVMVKRMCYVNLECMSVSKLRLWGSECWRVSAERGLCGRVQVRLNIHTRLITVGMIKGWLLRVSKWGWRCDGGGLLRVYTLWLLCACVYFACVYFGIVVLTIMSIVTFVTRDSGVDYCDCRVWMCVNVCVYFGIAVCVYIIL